MLRAFGKGLEIDAAFKEAFNVTLDDLQVSFDAAMKKKYAAMSAALKRPELPEKPTLDQLKTLAADNPGSFAVQMRLGAGAVRSRAMPPRRSRRSSARRSCCRRPTAMPIRTR